ncbi:hypothetical protein [Photorhabdus namnaonensis]|uniref:DUF551 domain-containing protein n=1 Tax=Photorhabdus namnaonensis TaxID=1851568 RepID=A0A1B8YFQ0_9GAMM|nr:hypothetical protein [Photorhabdus namnaonensis]OCA53897.1 hypothetical protein Phpb_03001 [Photorhabdus namnaonensis]
MTKNTESLISACHELARTASCDDYLILNDVADKLESLRKERDSYKEMFYDSCKGLAAIADAAGIKAEDDSGSPGQVIEKIESMLNIDWNFTEHPEIKVGEEVKCWAYIKKTFKFGHYEYDELTGKPEFVSESIKEHFHVSTLIYVNKSTPSGENEHECEEEKPDWALEDDEYEWVHVVGWAREYSHPDYSNWVDLLEENEKVLAWAEFIEPDAPEIE